MRIPAGDIEALVLDRLRALLSSRTDIGDALTPLDLDPSALDAALRKALKLSKTMACDAARRAKKPCPRK